MDECPQARHGEIQCVSQQDYERESDPVKAWYRNPVMHHHAQIVERASEHSACKSECIETDVAEDIAEKSCSHVVRIPESGAYIYKRISSRRVEYIDAEAGNYAEDYDRLDKNNRHGIFGPGNRIRTVEGPGDLILRKDRSGTIIINNVIYHLRRRPAIQYQDMCSKLDKEISGNLFLRDGLNGYPDLACLMNRFKTVRE